MAILRISGSHCYLHNNWHIQLSKQLTEELLVYTAALAMLVDEAILMIIIRHDCLSFNQGEGFKVMMMSGPSQFSSNWHAQQF